jgi:hypothetical protein
VSARNREGAHRRRRIAAAGGEEEGGGGGYGRARVFRGKRGQHLNGVREEGERPRGGVPSAATLAQPVADGAALPRGLANGRSRRGGEGGAGG